MYALTMYTFWILSLLLLLFTITSYCSFHITQVINVRHYYTVSCGKGTGSSSERVTDLTETNGIRSTDAYGSDGLVHGRVSHIPAHTHKRASVPRHRSN